MKDISQVKLADKVRELEERITKLEKLLNAVYKE